MTQKSILNMITFGFWEYQLTLIFSLIISLPMLIQEVFYPVIICTVILIIDLIVFIWHLWNKKRAKAYLIAAIIRLSLLIAVLALLQQMNRDMEPPNLYVAIGSLALSVCIIVIYYIMNAKKWNNTFETWQQVKKVDLEHKKFSIIADAYSGLNIDNRANLKQFLVMVIFVTIGCFLSWVIGEFMSNGYQITGVSVCFLVGIYILSIMLSHLILWTIKIIKIEKEMNIEFLTEYADKEEFLE